MYYPILQQHHIFNTLKHTKVTKCGRLFMSKIFIILHTFAAPYFKVYPPQEEEGRATSYTFESYRFFYRISHLPTAVVLNDKQKSHSAQGISVLSTFRMEKFHLLNGNFFIKIILQQDHYFKIENKFLRFSCTCFSFEVMTYVVDLF